MTIPTLYKYILFFLLFSPYAVFAQNNSNNFEDAYEADSLYAVRHAIKFDPLQIVFGDYSIDYEHILFERYSAEVGLGFTRRNYAASLFDYSLDNLGKNVKIKTGLALSISARRYFKNTGELNGPYLSANFTIRNYGTDYNVVDAIGVLTSFSFSDTRKITSYGLIFGYQALPATSNVFADFYVGVALRNKDFRIVKSDEINNPESYSVVGLTENGFGVEVGIKIGFGF